MILNVKEGIAMSYTAIYARNSYSELCQSKQGFFFVRVERCFDYFKNDKTWSDWFPVVEIARDSGGHIVAKINSKDSFVYTSIENRTVNYLIPRIGGIVNSVDSKRERGHCNVLYCNLCAQQAQ